MDEMDRRNVEDDPTIMGNDVAREPNVDDRDVTARPVRDADDPTAADYVGETAGGISGGIAGAAIGSIGGPVGTLIGGLAGVIGGWWAGRSIAEAAKDYGDIDDRYYRTHYDATSRASTRSFDDVRPAYQIGHLASRNPDYRGRDFDAVERDLRRGWSDDVSARHGDWASVRDYAREGYTRGRSTLEAKVDDIKDRIDGNPASRPGPDPTDRRL